jgi:hypothetical protein
MFQAGDTVVVVSTGKRVKVKWVSEWGDMTIYTCIGDGDDRTSTYLAEHLAPLPAESGEVSQPGE